ncbi:MAG: type II toxin-antitoxin system HicB family antitoxin [Rhodanobacter sp.]
MPDLPGCVAAGESEDEALSLIREAIELHLEALQAQGLQVPGSLRLQAPSSRSPLHDLFKRTREKPRANHPHVSTKSQCFERRSCRTACACR